MQGKLNMASPEYSLERMKDAGLFFNDDLTDNNLTADMVKHVPESIAAAYQVVPICMDQGILVLATCTEQTLKEDSRIARLLGCKVKLLLAAEDNVQSALVHYYNIDSQRQTYRGKISSSQEVDTTPLKRKIDTIIQDAIKKGASDIHFRPAETSMCVEFRINGHLIDFSSQYVINYDEVENAVNIIKSKDTSGNANISSENMPNSGSFTVRHGNTLVYVRLSTVPIASIGSDRLQKVNLRLLPQKKKTKKLDDLGYTAEDLTAIRMALTRSATGMYIISGETGSGKTTSLYAQIEDVLEMRRESLNVITIENPVEIHDSRFSQVQVRIALTEELSLTAPKILKVCMRQDPDLILYGEIRDQLDAKVAVEAAQTGHKVFSTVHATNCVTTIARLLDLGLSRTSLLSAINLIMSQKLVGILCPYCSRPHKLTKREKMVLTSEEISRLSKANLREPGDESAINNCSYCDDHGYEKRTVIAEYILFDRKLRDAFLNPKLGFTEIADILKTRKFCPMWEKAFELVVDGKTDLMEAINRIGKDE